MLLCARYMLSIIQVDTFRQSTSVRLGAGLSHPSWFVECCQAKRPACCVQMLPPLLFPNMVIIQKTMSTGLVHNQILNLPFSSPPSRVNMDISIIFKLGTQKKVSRLHNRSWFKRLWADNFSCGSKVNPWLLPFCGWVLVCRTSLT